MLHVVLTAPPRIADMRHADALVNVINVITLFSEMIHFKPLLLFHNNSQITKDFNIR